MGFLLAILSEPSFHQTVQTNFSNNNLLFQYYFTRRTTNKRKINTQFTNELLLRTTTLLTIMDFGIRKTQHHKTFSMC